MRRVSRLVLLRHAMPQVSATAPPSRWPLSQEGCRASYALRPRLRELFDDAQATWLTSSEVKAQQTMSLAAGVEPEVDARLDEVRRPAEPIGEAALAARRAWVAGRVDRRHEGWESPAEAAVRFDAALRSRAVAPLCVASHGMVITAWLIASGRLEAGDRAAAYWSELQLPDLIVVEDT